MGSQCELMAASPSTLRTGTQSIERAVLVLRELATRGATGWSLRDLAEQCALDHGTVHRILQCLVRERMVQQRESDRRYVVGPLNFELGASVPRYGEFAETARTTVRRIAQAIPKVVVLAYLRSNDECVCIARAGSSSYTREGTGIRVGQRAALLSLAGGIAILSALPAGEAQAIAARNRQRLAHLGQAHLARVDALLRRGEKAGYVVSAGVVWQEVNSLAVPFRKDARPLGSLAISGADTDYPAAGMRRFLPEIEAAAAGMSSHAERL